MNDDRYLRSIKDLEKVGSKWWPKEVREEAMKVSILQYLLDTQEKIQFDRCFQLRISPFPEAPDIADGCWFRTYSAFQLFF